MRHRRLRHGLAVATSILATFGAATAAQAATTVTVTGDDGNPVGLNAGAPTIRNMAPDVGLGFPAGATGYFNATFAGPNGTAAGSPMSCFIYDTGLHRGLDFLGNGTYTVTIQNFARGDGSCTRVTSTETYTFAINASVAVASPPGPFLIRAPNSFRTNTLSLPITGNPGAGGYDVQYGLGAVLNPDGSISGAPQQGFVNSTTNTIDLSFRTPGDYTVVMRAHALGNPAIGTAWSAPVHVIAISPFDLSSLSLPDSRGPSYLIRGYLNDRTIRGRVTLALSKKGKRNRYGRYRRIGKVSISSRGTFTKRFTQRASGTYRLRIHYAGSRYTPAASVYNSIRFTRRLVFR